MERVAVLDDLFPDLLTAFRVAEYNWYLNAFPQLRIFSTNHKFEAAHAGYAAVYPEHADRVLSYDDRSLDGSGFAYMNFLNNAYRFLPELEQRGIEFLFTLYPGGGFGLNDPESDAKLDRVLASTQLRSIVATQPVTVEYLAARTSRVAVHEINGVGVSPKYFGGPAVARLFPEPGAARICFVAEKYMERGANKGYPEFVTAATALAREFPSLEFSVVGSFGPDDIPLEPDVAARFRFLGRLDTDDLKAFFQRQHMIISPNRPFVLAPGNFDGFPTGCCVEASLCGVTVVCSDVLDLNRNYVDAQDIIICNPDPVAIIDRVRALVLDPERMTEIGARGRDTSLAAYAPSVQLGSRAALLAYYAGLGPH